MHAATAPAASMNQLGEKPKPGAPAAPIVDAAAGCEAACFVASKLPGLFEPAPYVLGDPARQWQIPDRGPVAPNTTGLLRCDCHRSERMVGDAGSPGDGSTATTQDAPANAEHERLRSLASMREILAACAGATVSAQTADRPGSSVRIPGAREPWPSIAAESSPGTASTATDSSGDWSQGEPGPAERANDLPVDQGDVVDTTPLTAGVNEVDSAVAQPAMAGGALAVIAFGVLLLHRHRRAGVA